MSKIVWLVVSLIFSANAAAKWTYAEKKDEMRGTSSASAYVVSLNAANFKFPYNGGSRLLLALNKNEAKEGKSVCGYKKCTAAAIMIPKGQFECQSMYEKGTGQDVCYISAKFDDGQVEKYVVNVTEGSCWLRHSDNLRFLEKLMSAKKVIVEAGFFREAPKQFKFDISGLKWEEDRSSGVLPGYGQPESVW